MSNIINQSIVKLIANSTSGVFKAVASLSLGQLSQIKGHIYDGFILANEGHRLTNGELETLARLADLINSSCLDHAQASINNGLYERKNLL